MSDTATLNMPLHEFPRLNLRDDVDRTRPVPILIKVAKGDETPNVFYAPAAERFAADLAGAELLERRAASFTPEARSALAERREAEALIKAETIAAEDWTGWVSDGEEAYASTVEELVERIVDLGGEAPSHCYTTVAKGFDFSLEDAIENYLMDEHHENAECRHLDKLLAFYAEWKKGETVTTYWPANTIIVVDPDRFAAQIAKAKALLAKPEVA